MCSKCVDVWQQKKPSSTWHLSDETGWRLEHQCITIREPSVHGYPGFLVRSVCGAQRENHSVKLHYHTGKVRYS
jgi:hypothetical protein